MAAVRDRKLAATDDNVVAIAVDIVVKKVG